MKYEKLELFVNGYQITTDAFVDNLNDVTLTNTTVHLGDSQIHITDDLLVDIEDEVLNIAENDAMDNFLSRNEEDHGSLL